jgi:cytochrome c-type biogenesis protein
LTTPIISENTFQPAERWRVFIHALAFVLGFSLIFIVGWGGSITLLGQLFITYKTIIAQIGGILIIAFGLATLGIIRMPWQYYADTRPHFERKAGGYASSGMMGLFFGAGWSPCIGTTLGAILTLGLSSQDVGQAMWLSSGYSLGLGIPFLVMGLGLERASGWVKKMRAYTRTLQIVSGIMMISIGILLVTNWMSLISIWAFRNGLFVDVFSISTGVPSYLTAVAAGLLSFFSPCVLPLVPGYLGYLSGQAVKGIQG